LWQSKINDLLQSFQFPPGLDALIRLKFSFVRRALLCKESEESILPAEIDKIGLCL
jgi:hypothetical protein